MNQTLEAMARAIFKSWFVDFDPVRAKAEGRQPFGMDIDTAALFPELPVIKITELKYGVSDSTACFEGDFDEKYSLGKDDLLFAWSGNPETSLDVFWWRDGEALLNQHIFRIIPKEGIEKRFLFYLFKFLRPTFVRTARDKATSMGHVKVSDLKRLEAIS